MEAIHVFLCLVAMSMQITPGLSDCPDPPAMGTRYEDCLNGMGRGGGTQRIAAQVDCCQHYEYTGPGPQRYYFPGAADGPFTIIIEHLDLNGAELTIKKVNCDGECKWLVIDGSVSLPFVVDMNGGSFTLASGGVSVNVTFSVYSASCDCGPCRTTYYANPQNPVSGEEDVTIDGNNYKIYCEFLGGGDGCVYISRNSLMANPPSTLTSFHNADDFACIKFKKSGNQKMAIITQLAAFAHNPLSFQVNSFTDYQLQGSIKNSGNDYLYLGIIPQAQLARHMEQGYKANGFNYTFNNCDGNRNSYFAFDTRAQTGTQIGPVPNPWPARTWVTKSTASAVTLADYFFYFLEEHQGGCGVLYPTSWVSLGLPFNY